jgi:hypothetical protein
MRRIAKAHTAETDARNLHPGVAQPQILHVILLFLNLCLLSAEGEQRALCLAAIISASMEKMIEHIGEMIA